MATGKQLTNFNAAASISDGDQIYVAQGGAGAGIEKAATAAQIATYVQAPFAEGTATDAGDLTGEETSPISRGAGLLQTTLATIAAFVLSIFTVVIGTATGLIGRTLLAELLDMPVSVKRFGAKGDGVTDDSTAILNWLNYLIASGCPGWVPNATYYMASALTANINGNLDVRAARNAIFKGGSSISQVMILLVATVGEQYQVSWNGGKFDISGTIYLASTLSGSGLGLQLVYKFSVENVDFIGPADYTQGGSFGGDTGLTLVSCRAGRVTGCSYSGMRDTGMYITGDSNVAETDSDGADIVVMVNNFERCAAMVSVKRQSRRVDISHNTGDYNYRGIVSVDTDVVRPDPPAGGQLIVSFNQISHTAKNAIDLQYSDAAGDEVMGNTILDFGYALDGVTPVSNPTAILLEGASDSVIQANTVGMKDWVAAGSHSGLLMQSFTYNGTSYSCENNRVALNKFVGLDIGIRETTGQADNNTYQLNAFRSVTTQYSNIQPSSTIFQCDTGTWPVTLYDAASGGNASPTTATGQYTKIGNIVIATFSLTGIALGSMVSTNPVYVALPFAASANVGAVGPILLSNVTFPSGCTSVSMTLSAGQQRALLTASGNGVGNKSVAVSNLASGGTSGIVQATITYPAAS